MTNAGNGLAEAEAGPTAAAASAEPAVTATRRTATASEIGNIRAETVAVARGRLIVLVAEALRLPRPAMVSRLRRCGVALLFCEAETDDGQIIFALLAAFASPCNLPAGGFPS